jgi:hypothetical protein
MLSDIEYADWIISEIAPASNWTVNVCLAGTGFYPRVSKMAKIARQWCAGPGLDGFPYGCVVLDSSKPFRKRGMRRDGRVAEGARLESVYTARYPGFESLSLRHTTSEPIAKSLQKPTLVSWAECSNIPAFCHIAKILEE